MRFVTTAQVYSLVVLAAGVGLALAGSRFLVRGDVFSGTLGGASALGMILLAVVVRGF